ncbi:pikachurin [Drosophila elegans]|uniref:pikachurin n=1 Tax=Drosophila elegans TaxID=30023 RepID=UPI0007E8394A|nr:pikachurin [Drosophila elegans]XP_041563349.1 pikachurin [Drosophila elegans]
MSTSKHHHYHGVLLSMWLLLLLSSSSTSSSLVSAAVSAIAEPEEAAFQGHCGHTSPCEQLCYEIHDGMYECDCIEGYELNKNGYSCQVINATANGLDGRGKSDEDVLYQKGASFSAKLANDDGVGKSMAQSPFAGPTSQSASPAGNGNGEDESGSESDSYDYGELEDNNSETQEQQQQSLNLQQQQQQRQQQQQQKVNSNDYYISAESINFNSESEGQEVDVADFKAASTTPSVSAPPPTPSRSTTSTTRATTTTTTTRRSPTATEASRGAQNQVDVDYGSDDYSYSYKSDMSVYDDVNNNQLNLRRNSNSKSQTYQQTSNTNTAKSRRKNPSITSNKVQMHITRESTNLGNISGVGAAMATDSSPTCNLDCGSDGICALEATAASSRCLCPFGKSGAGCQEDIRAHVPRFAKRSWLAFPALHGAYKHVQLRIEFRPESFDGIILLSGERDDLTGDFMALLLNKGFVEFWFDCGSGVGSVRSRETILLNEWNSVIIYRHRWDAWLVLNHGTKVQGRSNGLFSRITFREPVFLGGIGNITGLAKRLPLAEGFAGCIRRFVANEHDYKFTEHPLGDVINGFDIQDCSTDKCVRYPCQHGGKCLPSDQGAICLCPIGFVGDLCEIRMDLQVPAFNGSSFLRYAPLGDSALIWLELKVTLKPEQADGLVLYSGPEHRGDFIALYLNDGFVEFAFDLGSGPALVRSEHSVSLGQWHTIKISRTARLAVLKVDQHQEVMTISSNGFWHLSLDQNLFVGGVNHMDRLPLDLKYKPFFVGCIQRIDINGHSLGIVAEALGGSNIGNCPHACVARPCGPLAECVPQMESYECRCSIHNERCNKAAEVPLEQLPELNIHKSKVLETKDNGEEAVKKVSAWAHKKHAKKHRNLHKPTPATSTSTSTTTTTEAPERLEAATAGALSNEEIEDDIIFRFVQQQQQQQEEIKKQQMSSTAPPATTTSKPKPKPRLAGKHHASKHEHHQKPNAAFTRKLSRLPTHYESFQTNPDSDILTFEDNNDWVASLQQQEYGDAMAASQAPFAGEELNGNPPPITKSNDKNEGDDEDDAFVFDESLFDASDGTEEYQRKQLAQDMKRILSNSNTHSSHKKAEVQFPSDGKLSPDGVSPNEDTSQYSDDYNEDELLTPVMQAGEEEVKPDQHASSTPQTHTDWSLLKKFDLSAEHQSQVQGVRKNFGACFAGSDSYFHYNDADTMSQVISYSIDLNLRIKTHSENGVILWTGRQATTDEHADYLSLGIEQGYLHFRYDLGSGEVDIRFNGTKVSDGLWHRVRAIRNSQEGYLEVDGRKTATLRAPGKLRQLNTDTGLYVGGMPDVGYFTHQRYSSGIVGCISEIVLAGEMKLNFDPNTLGTEHNVETGLL